MTQSFSIRHVLITGASTGIGRACALQLSRHGFFVWAGVRTPEDARSLEQAAAGASGALRPVQLEVTDTASIRSAAEEIRALAPEGLCGLVNNAGICAVGPVEFISLPDWQHQLDVNFFGVIAVTQAMLPLLRTYNTRCPNPGSRIINMGSITGEISTPLFGAYSASKFALRAMNDALRLELRPEGIRVCLIVPGTIQSEIWRKEKEGVDAIKPGSPARQHYGRLIENVAGYVFSCADKAIPAQRVADAVQHGLTAARPRIEYRVGWEAQIGSRAKKLIPHRLFDFLLARKLGVPRKSDSPASPQNAAQNTPHNPAEISPTPRPQ